MARVTVEDCIVHVPNRFELVLLAAQRTKQISSGNPLTVERDNDKDAVISLREIADQTVDLGQLQENVIEGFFKRPVSDIADKRLLTKGEEIPAEIEEAFKDAAQHISPKQSAPEEAEGEVEGEAGGPSFEGENVEAED